ncbi:YlzJ-like family protein [Paenibacillus sp. NPDC058071]|uniref:YlzJ-like family protein n=1 Tax=Paenibacillus sp. NPDC058071 TaxID=3346326 RepID=UPI0036DB9310
MTLYTIMPLELVLDGIHNEGNDSHEIWLDGVCMEVRPLAPGIGQVVRLLQCQLNDYLNPQLTPGSIIRYGPK